jgi:hypothetical protein
LLKLKLERGEHTMQAAAAAAAWGLLITPLPVNDALNFTASSSSYRVYFIMTIFLFLVTSLHVSIKPSSGRIYLRPPRVTSLRKLNQDDGDEFLSSVKHFFPASARAQ